MPITKIEQTTARARAAQLYDRAHIVITDAEKEAIEVADFGLGCLEQIGVELVMYVNTERVCAKEVALFPWQICPEHRHPAYDGKQGKEETFRCRWGMVYLYVEGEPAPNPKAKVPPERRPFFTVWHEIVLQPGDQYTVMPDRKHWFQAGPAGAVLSEFSTPSTDEADIFTDPGVKRIPEII